MSGRLRIASLPHHPTSSDQLFTLPLFLAIFLLMQETDILDLRDCPSGQLQKRKGRLQEGWYKAEDEKKGDAGQRW